jgi:hypothetical protein
VVQFNPYNCLHVCCYQQEELLLFKITHVVIHKRYKGSESGDIFTSGNLIINVFTAWVEFVSKYLCHIQNLYVCIILYSVYYTSTKAVILPGKEGKAKGFSGLYLRQCDIKHVCIYVYIYAYICIYIIYIYMYILYIKPVGEWHYSYKDEVKLRVIVIRWPLVSVRGQKGQKWSFWFHIEI